MEKRKLIILIFSSLLFFTSITYTFARDNKKFQHDAMHMALYETGIIFYATGYDSFQITNLGWKDKAEEVFPKWLTLQYPHGRETETIVDLARAYVIINYITYIPRFVDLDEKVLREMRLIIKDNTTIITKEFQEYESRYRTGKYQKFLDDYTDHLVDRLSLLEQNKEPKANSLDASPIGFEELMAGVTELAFYTGRSERNYYKGKYIPDRYIVNDKLYEGYDALFLQILSLEEQYKGFRTISGDTPMISFSYCLSKIDRVISEIMINDYIEKPVYKRTAYAEYNNGLRIRQSDEIYDEIKRQGNRSQEGLAIDLFMSVCRQQEEVGIYY